MQEERPIATTNHIQDIEIEQKPRRIDGRNLKRKSVEDDKTRGIASIADNSITLAMLVAIISPIRIVKLSGTITWSGSGATLASSVSGALSTDIVMATITVKPTQAAYLVRAVPTTDTITFELSAANTSNDAQISYVIFRATS